MDLSQTAVDDGFKLLVSLAFVPVLLGVGRRIRMPEAVRAVMIGITALIGSFAVNFLARELGFSAVEWIRWVRHLSVALAGIAFAWAAWELRKHEAATAGGSR
jgi:protein-S-isoprenylcysteine O-methyltransferase Ste14